MGWRWRLLPTLAGLLAASAAGAAEITQVTSSGEVDHPFGFALGVRWERIERRAQITREFRDAIQTGRVQDELELDFSEVQNRLVPRLAIGLWHDLELRAELPVVLADEPSWRYAPSGGGRAAGGSAPVYSIADNAIDASGNACPGTPPGNLCPMFPVGHKLRTGTALDDLRVGLAWAVTSQRRTPWWPTWVVSLDVTAPTAARFDPARGRLDAAAFFDPSRFSASHPAPLGRKIWIWELATAVSRRMGVAEPYVRFSAKLPQRTNQTYSNCEHAAELAAIGQMSSAAAQNCQSATWKTRALADPPQVYALALGTELLLGEDKAASQRYAIDLRVGADYTTRARWYGELTPATGKLLASAPFLSTGARLGLDVRANRVLVLGLHGAVAHDFGHFATGESQGSGLGSQVAVNGPDQNPNFDWRWDPPGRRFKVANVLLWSVGASAEIRF
jgi:hypothetical protein